MGLDRSLIKGSLILLITFNLYNLLNFVFHFSMARLLSVADYGILLTLFSLTYLFAVLSESVQLVIVKYASKEDDKGKLKNLFKRTLRKSFSLSLILFGLYAVIAIPLAYLLKIGYTLMVLNGVMIMMFLLLPVSRGMMQGKKRFKQLGVNMLIESVFKLALAIIFVYIGWRVYGAIVGTILGFLTAFILSFASLNDIMKSDEKKINTEDIYNYAKPAFGINLAILLFFSLDVIIAKIFFSEGTAGAYAISSILAKTIFMGTQPISRAMFPLSSESNSDSKKSEDVFGSSFVILFGIIVASLLLFYFFPEEIVKIFSGKEIFESVSILFYLSIAMSLFSFANLVLLYKLSMKKVRGYSYLYLLIGFEVFLLSYFSKGIIMFSIALITAAAIFLWGVIFLVKE